MTPGERELGELAGEMRAIGKQLAEMQQRTSADHAAVIGRLDALRVDLDRKASEDWVKEHEKRIDSLEKTRDEGSGAARLIDLAKGSVVLILAIGAFVAGKGGL